MGAVRTYRPWTRDVRRLDNPRKPKGFERLPAFPALSVLPAHGRGRGAAACWWSVRPRAAARSGVRPKYRSCDVAGADMTSDTSVAVQYTQHSAH